MHPQGQYVAGGSTTGTLSVVNLAAAARMVPEPSFLYHWLSTKESKQTAPMYLRLLATHPHLANMQV